MSKRLGEPGEPGEPGEEGVLGGGHGGRGGRGGRGGPSPAALSTALILFVVIVAIGLSIGTFILATNVSKTADKVSRNTDTIAQLQRRDAAQTRVALVTRVKSEIQQCERVNAQRHEDNDTAFRQKMVTQLLSRHIASDALLKTGFERIRELQDAATLARLSKSIPYEPPTNCARAIVDPTYRRPPPKPFPPGYRVDNPKSLTERIRHETGAPR